MALLQISESILFKINMLSNIIHPEMSYYHFCLIHQDVMNSKHVQCDPPPSLNPWYVEQSTVLTYCDRHQICEMLKWLLTKVHFIFSVHFIVCD